MINREIARSLFVTEKTVETHLGKTDATRRACRQPHVSHSARALGLVQRGVAAPGQDVEGVVGTQLGEADADRGVR